MKFFRSIPQYLQQAHYLSLDVVIGAILSHVMAARLPDGHGPVSWATVSVLAICVFIIYIVDRILDVYKGMNTPILNTPRHRFHAGQKTTLARLLVGLVVVAAVLLFWLPRGVLIFGSVLTVLCGLYVWIVSRLPTSHSSLVWKEPVVAVLYTVGVWGSAWSAKPVIGWSEICLGLLFVGIAFQNLLLFSVMESYEFPQNSYSLATVWGFDRSDVVLRTLTLVITVLALVLFFLADDRFAQRAAVVEGLMSAVLYAIQRYPKYFLVNERYRWVGDGVFWLPVLIL